MTVTCMFDRDVFVMKNKTCVIRSIVRRSDSCRYRQEDPSPYPSLLVTAGVGNAIVNRDTEEDDPVAQQCMSDNVNVSHVWLLMFHFY